MQQNIVLFSQTRQIFPVQQTSTFMKRCERQKRFKASSLAAIKFIMLRQQGETLKNAINFTTKRHCRYDNTQLIDGTKNFRIFKRKQKDPKYTNYGWMMHGEPEVYSDLPDIAQILKETQAQDKLISSIVKTKVETCIPELDPYRP